MLMEKLKENRLATPKVFYSDNCCSTSSTVHQVFGGQVEVKLDPFHFMKRYTDTLCTSFFFFSSPPPPSSLFSIFLLSLPPPPLSLVMRLHDWLLGHRRAKRLMEMVSTIDRY